MIPCPGCGACLKYDIRSKSMLCSYCGNTYDPYDFDKTAKDAVKRPSFDAYIYTCPGCGAELYTADDTDITAFCSYCGNADFIFDRMEKKKRPDGIIPFLITKERCKELYLKKAKKAIFTSHKYKNKDAVESFRGIYMPYWSYSVDISGDFSTKGTLREDQEDEYMYVDYDISGTANAHYAGFAHDASRAFDDSISECLAPYDIGRVSPFTPGYLSGFYADAPDSDETLYDDEVLEFASDYSKIKLSEHYAKKGITLTNAAACKFPAAIKQVRCIMYPVWFMSVRHGKKVSYATVNGSTGKVVADFPVSPWRIIGAVLGAAAVLFLLMTLLFMPTPAATVVLTTILALVGSFFNLREYRRIFSRDKTSRKPDTAKERRGWLSKGDIHRVPDFIPESKFRIFLTIFILYLGVMLALAGAVPFIWVPVALVLLWVLPGVLRSVSVKARKNSSNFRNIIVIVFDVLMVLCCLAVLIAKPLNKYYYYFSYCLTAVFLFLSIEVSVYHQILSRRRPPQFNKTGGDNNA